MTYYEIYEERIIDLLARDSSLTSSSSSSSRTLRVRWRKRDGFYVPNLTFETCASASEALACVRRGCARRHVRANAVNAESSRSHAVLTVYLDRGKVTFVDLAGSERLKRGGGDDESSRETSLINKSLFALGKVISTLADGPNDAKASTAHVPYRDSKLTKLMMDSLGGQSLTLMIACCSSEERHARETVRTLQYAARVASIVLDVDHGVRDHAPAVEDADAHRTVDELRADNRALRRRLAALREPSPCDRHQPRRARASGGHPRHRRFSNSAFHTSAVIHRVRRVESPFATTPTRTVGSSAKTASSARARGSTSSASTPFATPPIYESRWKTSSAPFSTPNSVSTTSTRVSPSRLRPERARVNAPRT